eukprot:358696-Chlamydomonas_euryale.AAC.6
MLGVDRLDMVKGIPQKLLAYEKFLEEHPEWRDRECSRANRASKCCAPACQEYLQLQLRAHSLPHPSTLPHVLLGGAAGADRSPIAHRLCVEYQKLPFLVPNSPSHPTHKPHTSHTQVLLVQIAVPSRTDVPEYQKLRSMVHEIVGRINGRFGTLTYVPIYHLDTSLSFTELSALYAVTDVALVTSLRDGMNLVGTHHGCWAKGLELVLSGFYDIGRA